MRLDSQSEIVRVVFHSTTEITEITRLNDPKGLNTLTLSQTTNLDPSKQKEFADDNFSFDGMEENSSNG